MIRERIPQQLKDRLRKAASSITNVSELREYAEQFPSAEAGQIIVEALDFFSEPKTISGKRNGKKIYQHVKLGYGPRLKGTETFLPQPDWLRHEIPGWKLMIGISQYAEKEWPKRHKLDSKDADLDEKNSRTERSQQLVYAFIYELTEAIRRRL